MITKYLDAIVVTALVVLSAFDKDITPWIVLIPILRPAIDFGTKILTHKKDAIADQFERRIATLESAINKLATKNFMED